MTIFPSSTTPGSGCLVLEAIERRLLPSGRRTDDIRRAEPRTCPRADPGDEQTGGVLLNKVEDGINPSELYAKEHDLKILASCPTIYAALESSNAELLVVRSEKYRTLFLELLKEVVDEATLAAQR